LAERVEVEDRRFLIIGMGVNVLTLMDDAPAEVRARAAALVDLVADPESLSLDGLLDRFLDRFSRRLSDLANDDPALVDLWNAFDLLRDQPIAVAQGDRVVEGMGAGIDPLGGLILCDGAERRTLYGGTVVKT
jgi:biotin-(acetyl-CoA carboxylase) ligase